MSIKKHINFKDIKQYGGVDKYFIATSDRTPDSLGFIEGFIDYKIGEVFKLLKHHPSFYYVNNIHSGENGFIEKDVVVELLSPDISVADTGGNKDPSQLDVVPLSANTVERVVVTPTLPLDVDCDKNDKLKLITGLMHRMILTYGSSTEEGIYQRLISIIDNGLLLCPPEKNFEACTNGIYTVPLTKCAWNLQSHNMILAETSVIFIISRSILEHFDYIINPDWMFGRENWKTTFKNECNDCLSGDITNQYKGIDRFILQKNFYNKEPFNSCISPDKQSNSPMNKSELLIKGDIPAEYIQEVWFINNAPLFNKVYANLPYAHPFKKKLVNIDKYDENKSLKDNFRDNSHCIIYNYGCKDKEPIEIDRSCSINKLPSDLKSNYAYGSLRYKYLKYKRKYIDLKNKL